MKRQFFVPMLVGAMMLTGLGIARVAVGQSAQTQTTPVQANTPMNINDYLPSNLPYEDFEAIDFDPESIPYDNPESDPSVEARNIEHEFRGIDLTPEQLEQVTQVRRQFRTELINTTRNNFPKLLLAMFLPQERAETLLGNLLGEPIETYGENLSQILTPEQLKIWQRNAEEDSSQPQQPDAAN